MGSLMGMTIFSACWAHEGETGTDESAEMWTERNWQGSFTLLQPWPLGLQSDALDQWTDSLQSRAFDQSTSSLQSAALNQWTGGLQSSALDQWIHGF